MWFQNWCSMVPNPDMLPTPFPPVSLDYFLWFLPKWELKVSHDHCVICQCEHGMQLSLQLLTSKKQVVKAITGHISCIRNICVYRYSCCIGGHSNGRKYVTLRELRLYQKNRKHTKWKKYIHIFTNISFSWRTRLLPRYKAHLLEKEQSLGDSWVTSDGRCQAGIVCAPVLSLESHPDDCYKFT